MVLEPKITENQSKLQYSILAKGLFIYCMFVVNTNSTGRYPRFFLNIYSIAEPHTRRLELLEKKLDTGPNIAQQTVLMNEIQTIFIALFLQYGLVVCVKT
jgi:hypothetical protein